MKKATPVTDVALEIRVSEKSVKSLELIWSFLYSGQ